MFVSRIAVLAAVVAGTAVIPGQGRSNDRFPSVNEAFAVVYPQPEQQVAFEGKTYAVRFAPASLTLIGQHLYALVARGQSTADCHGCEGFYSVTYVEDEPRLRRVGVSLTGRGSDDGGGRPPIIRTGAAIGSFVTLEVESNGLHQGEGERWVDLVRLGQVPEIVARGVPVGLDREGGCRISGAIQPAARDQTFKVAYHGSWRGESRYSWDGKAWRPAEPDFTLQSKCGGKG
jgi:hypothetical protein